METSKKKATKHAKHAKHQSNSFHFFRSEVWMPSCILRIGVHNCFPAKECKNRIQRLISDIISDFCTNCQCILQGWWWLNQRWGHSDASSRSLWFVLWISHARREQKHSRHVFDSRAHAKSCRSLNSIEGSVWNSKSKNQQKSKNPKNSAFQLKQLSIDRRGVDFSRFGHPENGIADEERPRLRGDRWHCVWKGGWFCLKGCHL